MGEEEEDIIAPSGNLRSGYENMSEYELLGCTGGKRTRESP